MISTIAIIFLSIGLIISIYVNYNLTKKLDIVEEDRDTYATASISLDMFLVGIRRKLVGALAHMRRIDKLGSFESDDETGIIFKTIKEIVEDLNKEFEWLEENPESDTTLPKKQNKQ